MEGRATTHAFAPRLLAGLWLACCVVLAGASPTAWAAGGAGALPAAHASAATAHAGSGDPADTTERPGERAQARYLAEQLRKHPVYVTDQAPRAMPRSAAPDFLAQAQRLTTPTYVLVLPDLVTTYGPYEDRLLRAVQRELKRDGLYVLLDASGGQGALGLVALAAGTDLPTSAAAALAADSLPDDATALDHFTRFVDALRGEGAAAEESPRTLYTSHEDRALSSSLTGVATALVPTAVVLTALAVIRRTGRSRQWLWLPVVGAVGLGLLIPSLANSWATATRAGGAPDPTARDLSLRVDRVVEGLHEAPVYIDPERPVPLSPAQRQALLRQTEELDVPLLLLFVTPHRDDESAGERAPFLEQVQESLGEKAVYVQVDAASRSYDAIEVVSYGAKLVDRQLRQLPEEVRFAEPRSAGEAPDPDALFRQVSALLEHVAETPVGPPGRPDAAEPVPDPVEARTLAPLLSGEFYRGLASTALVIALFLLGKEARRRLRQDQQTHAFVEHEPASARSDLYEAPDELSERWLLRTLPTELATLDEQLADFAGTGSERARIQAWECLDAATLLWRAGGEGQQGGLSQRDLVTALALVRAGRTALETAGRPRGVRRGAAKLCHLNPLHGKAPRVVDLAPVYGGDERRARSICVDCALAMDAFATGTRETVTDRRLLLPNPGQGDDPVPYEQLHWPLGESAAHGDVNVAPLVSQVKEQLGVHS